MRAVVFDLDGVLMESTPFHAQAYKKTPSPPPPHPADTATHIVAPLPLRRSSRTTHPPGHWKGCYTAPLTPLVNTPTAPINAAQRKVHNARLAAIRHRHHRLSNPPDTPLNNRPTTLTPDPLPPHRAEMSIRRASLLLPAPDITAGIVKELSKHFDTYESLKLIPRTSVESTAIFLRSKMLIKKKSNGLVTARLAIDGSR